MGTGAKLFVTFLILLFLGGILFGIYTLLCCTKVIPSKFCVAFCKGDGQPWYNNVVTGSSNQCDAKKLSPQSSYSNYGQIDKCTVATGTQVGKTEFHPSIKACTDACNNMDNCYAVEYETHKGGDFKCHYFNNDVSALNKSGAYNVLFKPQ